MFALLVLNHYHVSTHFVHLIIVNVDYAPCPFVLTLVSDGFDYRLSLLAVPYGLSAKHYMVLQNSHHYVCMVNWAALSIHAFPCNWGVWRFAQLIEADHEVRKKVSICSHANAHVYFFIFIVKKQRTRAFKGLFRFLPR